MRKPQIGVMGSAADLKYSQKIEQLAFETGKLLAQQGAIVLFGAEKDFDSLSTAAARGAKSVGGFVVGVTYGRGKNIWGKNDQVDVIIASGMERGGGREFVLVNSCDAIITISGGSGTLNEIAIAYQLNIPAVTLVGAGGWSDKLAGTFLDQRKRYKIARARSPKIAVRLALAMANGK